jgi:hypothetical protein
LVSLFEPARKLLAACQDFPEFDECPDNDDVHLHSAVAVQNRRKHRNTVLSESIGQIAPATAPRV